MIATVTVDYHFEASEGFVVLFLAVILVPLFVSLWLIWRDHR